MNLSGGLGRRINRNTNFDRISDLRIATLPSGVICLLSQILYRRFTSSNFSLKLISIQSVRLLVNQIPNILLFVGFHDIFWCCEYRLSEFLILPNQTSKVFETFHFNPEALPNISIVLDVDSKDFLSPSNKISESFAYCVSLTSMLLSLIPVNHYFLVSY